MMTQLPRQSVTRNQVGLVSIIVTVVLMLVISLISISFAKIIRREQRQQLDRQLSSRAFYAAESGVNLASSKLNSPAGLAGNKTTCGADANFLQPEYDLDTDTKVTCLTVNQTPPTLEYSSVDNKSRVIPINSSNGTAINTMTFSWQAATGGGAFGCAGVPANAFPTGSGATWNCGAPLLRVDIVPSGGDRNTLQNNTFTAFLYPVSGGNAGNFTFAASTGAGMGQILGVHCQAAPLTAANPLYCTADISGLNAVNYSVRIMSLYGTSKLTIFATNSGAPATKLLLSGAQAIVDSTAKAQDVLRRIQVRVPMNSNANPPDFAITAQAGICKRYFVVPPSTVTIDAPASADPACQFN